MGYDMLGSVTMKAMTGYRGRSSACDGGVGAPNYLHLYNEYSRPYKR